MEAFPRTGRRQFLNWFLGTTAGTLALSILYPILRFVSPPQIPESATNELDAGPENDPVLLEKGFKIVRFGAEPVILLKTSETTYAAFAATCTHLDCIVEYQKEKKRIWCNCHSGEYDTTGRNVAGPPPKPLAPFKVNVVAKAGGPGTIVISRA